MYIHVQVCRQTEQHTYLRAEAKKPEQEFLSHRRLCNSRKYMICTYSDIFHACTCIYNVHVRVSRNSPSYTCTCMRTCMHKYRKFRVLRMNKISSNYACTYIANVIILATVSTYTKYLENMDTHKHTHRQYSI